VVRSAQELERLVGLAVQSRLPIEQPTTFDFVINLQTARGLGITFPPEIMLQVTEVIQ
jgi:putative tryptophan/tyrosine transport system substrate-binding protein